MSRIGYVVAVTKCIPEAAEQYLIAEEWNVEDAIASIIGDRKMSQRGVIVFEGDYIRDTDGVVSKVVEFSNYDANGDACCHLANGRVVHTKDLTIDQILCESEVVL